MGLCSKEFAAAKVMSLITGNGDTLSFWQEKCQDKAMEDEVGKEKEKAFLKLKLILKLYTHTLLPAPKKM